MADLSRGNTRRNAEEIITKNRDAVLPTRRETRVGDVQVRADMRSASRGDGGVKELQRFFSELNQTVGAYYEHDIAQRTEDARGAYADGTVDAAAGREMDPEQAKAYAYRRGFTSVEAANRQTAFEREVQQETDAMINRGATVEEIETYQTQRISTFIGETADTYDTDETRYEIAQRLQRWGTAEDNRVGSAIKEKTDREFLDMTVSETQARLQRGEPVDLATEVANLEQAGLNGQIVQEALIKGIAAYAVQTGDLSGVYAALDARSAEDIAAEIEGARNAPEIEGEPLPPVDAPVAAETAATVETYKAPLEGRPTSGYGPRQAPIAGASTNHRAVDIAVPVGTEVGAPASGVVEFVGTRGNAGKMMIIRHADGSSTEFMHLDGFTVEQGATVTQGQVVARSGNTGNSTGPHLHWASKDADGNPRDPRSLVGQEIAGTAQAQAASDAASDVAAQTAERRPRRPGRSILTSEQQVYLTGVIEQVESDNERTVEKARQDRRDALAVELYEASLNGTNVDDRITAALQDETLTASEAMSYRSAFTSLRNDELEGEADEDVVLGYAEKFATERPNWGSISAQADRDYRAGRFGTGRAGTRAYLDIKQRAANGSRGDNAIPPEERRTATIARGYVASSLGGLFPAGVEPSPAQRRLIADAQIEWERRVAAGESPMTVADAIYADYSTRIRNTGRPAPAPGAPGAGTGRAPGQTQTTQPAPRTRYDARGNAIGD